MFTFQVMGGEDVRAVIEAARPRIFARVRETYVAHHNGETVNPNSLFLRFPAKAGARIIALPALVLAERPVAGIKWIASFPDNVERNVPRASAVLLLNDPETGYPFACLEAAQISAARTAASAALAAQELHGTRAARRIAVIGAGVISRNVLEFLRALDWAVDEVAVYDTETAYAAKAAKYVDALGYRGTVSNSLRAAVDRAEVVILATTAAQPYIDDDVFAPGQTVLNISLRDIAPETIARSHNVLDDVEHCLNAGTSPHLAVQKFGHRRFIDGTLAQLLLGELTLSRDKPLIFSPFGLGALDVAVGLDVFTAGAASGRCFDVPKFFAEVERW